MTKVETTMNLHFLVPGFSKCGTTSLCSMLGDHPQIFVPEGLQKEPAYFAYNFQKGWDWYEGVFESAKEGQLCGEGSTFYCAQEFVEQTCSRIKERFPEMKFIFIARHPIKRLESSFREMHHSGWKYGLEPEFSIAECLRKLPNMIEDTKYFSILSTYLKYFPEENIHTLFLEDLKKNPIEELQKCFSFLGVKSYDVNLSRAKQLNPASEKLQDSHFYRTLKRTVPRWVPFHRLKPQFHDSLLRSLGLRKTFQAKVEWKQEDLKWVQEQILEDSHAYLKFCGEPVARWDFVNEFFNSSHTPNEKIAA